MEFFRDLRITHDTMQLLQLVVSLLTLAMIMKRFLDARSRVKVHRAAMGGA